MRTMVGKKTVSVLFALSAVLPVGEVVGQDIHWQAPPKLDFEECLPLSRKVLPNPLFPAANNFLLVTQYEEKPNEPGDITVDGEYLNVYLVHGYIQPPGRKAGIVYNTQLIVTRWAYEAEGSTKTAKQWVIADRNRDGSLDKGYFQVIVQGPQNQVLSEARIELPGKALDGLQSYYEAALRKIEQKAAEESARSCPIV